VSLILYSLLLVLIPLSTGRVLSIPRFAAPIFPAFFRARLPVKFAPLRTALHHRLGAAAGFYTVQYFNQYWAN